MKILFCILSRDIKTFSFHKHLWEVTKRKRTQLSHKLFIQFSFENQQNETQHFALSNVSENFELMMAAD